MYMNNSVKFLLQQASQQVVLIPGQGIAMTKMNLQNSEKDRFFQQYQVSSLRQRSQALLLDW